MLALLLDLAFLAWCGLLLLKGLQSSDNWLGWFMFSRASYFKAELHDREGPIDIWSYLPHCQVILSRRQIERLLQHIQPVRQAGYIQGNVTMLTTDGEKHYTVRRTFLIPCDDEDDE